MVTMEVVIKQKQPSSDSVQMEDILVYLFYKHQNLMQLIVWQASVQVEIRSSYSLAMAFILQVLLKGYKLEVVMTVSLTYINYFPNSDGPLPHTGLLLIEAFDLKPLESFQNLCIKLTLILNTRLLLGVTRYKEKSAGQFKCQ